MLMHPKNFKNTQEAYKHGFGLGSDNQTSVINRAVGAVLRNEELYNPNSSPKDKSIVKGLGDGLMTHVDKSKGDSLDYLRINLNYLLKAARVYRVVGEGNQEIENELKGALENFKLKYSNKDSSDNFLILRSEKFLKKRGSGKNNLEDKIVAASLILSFIGSLFLLSPTITGNVIGFSKTSSNLFGVFGIILAFVAFFVYKKFG